MKIITVLTFDIYIYIYVDFSFFKPRLMIFITVNYVESTINHLS